MKKGLSIILEQNNGGPAPAPPRRGGSAPATPAGPNTGSTVTGGTVTTETGPSIAERVSFLLQNVKFYDGSGNKPLSYDSDAATNYISNVLGQLEKQGKVTDENRDDYVVQYMIKFFNDNNKYPFKFNYDPNFFDISFQDIMESRLPIGLEKILIESRGYIFEQAGDNTGYIQYQPGTAQFRLVNPERGTADWDRVTSDYVRKTQTPIEDSQFTQTSGKEDDPQQDAQQQNNSQPSTEKRPEEELGLSGEQIKDKAKIEGWAGIKEILKDSKYAAVKRAIEDKMREDYVLTFPGDETLDSYEVVDVVKLNPSIFEDLDIDSLLMYRMKKRSGDEIAQNLNNIIESGRVSKEFCKTAVKSFYELATDDYAIDIDSLKATALYLDRCRDQHGGKWGIGDVEFVDGGLKKSGTQFRLDRMSQLSPEFRINFADNTVSGQKFK
jgi:hypothetical protein